MERQYILGIFEREEDVLGATRVTREMGYDIHDVYAPYAVHGLPEAMGLKPSRLTWLCLMFGLIGFSVAIAAQFWISGVDWPLNVGGRPFNSLPAYLPVMFECIVLFGGIGVVLSFFIRTRLYPGKREWLIHPDVTNHRFVLAIPSRNASFDADTLAMLWERHRVVEVTQLSEATA